MTNTLWLSSRKQVEADQRQELLERRGGAADYVSAQRADAQGMSYISNSKQVIEEAYETGTAVLQSMSGQRERLKVHMLLQQYLQLCASSRTFIIA